MAGHFGQLTKMQEKADRLRAKAQMAEDPRIAERYLRRVDIILTSIDAVKNNWKAFGERARGNANFKGKGHSLEAREEMSRLRKDFWASKAGRQKMLRARRRRQYREAGKCLIRFPRMPASVDWEWLKDYRKRYKKITGKRLEIPRNRKRRVSSSDE